MRATPTCEPETDGPALRRTLGLLLWWSPAWAPLVLAAHLAFRGLEPAREEYRRLRREEPVVERRLTGSAERLVDLTESARAWNDPVYLERYRLQKAAVEAAALRGASDPDEGADALDGARPR